MAAAGNFSRKKPTEAAMALTWPGVPVTAWASMRPSRSNTPAERSPASRTEVEKAVRIRVWACSSTTEISRFHMICMWICSRAEFLLIERPSPSAPQLRPSRAPAQRRGSPGATALEARKLRALLSRG
jgi:hypothetical protein